MIPYFLQTLQVAVIPGIITNQMDVRQLLAQWGQGNFGTVEEKAHVPDGCLMGGYHQVGLNLLGLQGLHSLRLLLERILLLLERLGGLIKLPLNPLV